MDEEGEKTMRETNDPYHDLKKEDDKKKRRKEKNKIQDVHKN